MKYYSFNRYMQWLPFANTNQDAHMGHVVEALESFVTEHPTEALLVRLKKEGDSGEHSRSYTEEVTGRFGNADLWSIMYVMLIYTVGFPA